MLVNIGGAALDLDDVRVISGLSRVTFKDGSQVDLSPANGTPSELAKVLINALPTVKQATARRGLRRSAQ